jgi:hypothetical protein
MDIRPTEYMDSYANYERTGSRVPRPDLIDGRFRQFVRAERRHLVPDEVWRLIWLYSADNEPAVRLTSNGTKRLLRDVVIEYEKQTARGYTWPGNENQIKPLLTLLEKDSTLDPSYLRQPIPGEPADGSFYIEDGIHRLTTLGIHAARHNLDPIVEAYIGYFDPRPPSTLGILAYGSLIDDPGLELKDRIVGQSEVLTPFRVEFARRSIERGGGPTLVPVTTAGAPVQAVVLLLDDRLRVEDATHMLYRRERHLTDRTTKYTANPNPGTNTVVIDRLGNFHSIPVVLFTRIAANIHEVTGPALATHAILSARRADPGEDGISYFIAAKRNGIVTPLSVEYEREILRRTGTDNLEAALQAAQKSSGRTRPDSGPA